VGQCATVQGTADSTGTVAAKTVRITAPVNGQCGARFGAGANGG
jgi:septal ring factor EnvC (AmiA/AmiB activator)